MKYLKFFENIDNIISEIESIKYILEDEGYDVKIEKDELRNPKKNPIYVSIYKSINKVGKIKLDSIEYDEFINRLIDITKTFRYTIECDNMGRVGRLFIDADNTIRNLYLRLIPDNT